jgi:hypothetical protein
MAIQNEQDADRKKGAGGEEGEAAHTSKKPADLKALEQQSTPILNLTTDNKIDDTKADA